MTDRLTLSLWEEGQAHKAILFAWENAKSAIKNGKRLTLELRPETRSDAQNRHYHGLISQIAAHIGGDLADPDDAKRILISAFKIETQELLTDEWAKFGDLRMGRGLHKEIVVLGTQSRGFSKKLGAAFIEWLYAFGVAHKVQFKAQEGEQ